MHISKLRISNHWLFQLCTIISFCTAKEINTVSYGLLLRNLLIAKPKIQITVAFL